jgi:hypothetical protein
MSLGLGLDLSVGGAGRDRRSPRPNSVAPVISGTPTQGQTLTTTDGTWTGSPTFTYQWKRDGVAISSATASTYVPRGRRCGRVDHLRGHRDQCRRLHLGDLQQPRAGARLHADRADDVHQHHGAVEHGGPGVQPRGFAQHVGLADRRDRPGRPRAHDHRGHVQQPLRSASRGPDRRSDLGVQALQERRLHRPVLHGDVRWPDRQR